MTGSKKLMKIKLLLIIWIFGASHNEHSSAFLTRVLAELLQDTFGAYLLIKITSFAIPLMTVNLGQGLSNSYY